MSPCGSLCVEMRTHTNRLSVGSAHAHIQMAHAQRVEREADHLLNQLALLVERSRWHLGIVALGCAWKAQGVDQMRAGKAFALLRDHGCAPFDAWPSVSSDSDSDCILGASPP